MKPRFIRLRLEPTTLTHLMCICCSGFKTEFAVVPHYGLDDESEPAVGLHKKCMKTMHAKRAPSTTRSSTSNTPYARAENGFGDSRAE